MCTQGIIRVIHVLWQIMAKLGAAAKYMWMLVKNRVLPNSDLIVSRVVQNNYDSAISKDQFLFLLLYCLPDQSQKI